VFTAPQPPVTEPVLRGAGGGGAGGGGAADASGAPQQLLPAESAAGVEPALSAQSKIDVCETWLTYYPLLFAQPWGFRRALMGDLQDQPVSWLCTSNYPSLEFCEEPPHTPARGGSSSSTRRARAGPRGSCTGR
jgi:hypothetical protein